MGTHIQIGSRTLDFSRFPSRATKLRVARVDTVLVGVDDAGRLYSTEFRGDVAYLGETERLQTSLQCCEKLGLLSADEIKDRRQRVRLANEARDREWAAKDLQKGLAKLGLKPTKAQQAAIAKALKVSP